MTAYGRKTTSCTAQRMTNNVIFGIGGSEKNVKPPLAHPNAINTIPNNAKTKQTTTDDVLVACSKIWRATFGLFAADFSCVVFIVDVAV
jgi:hypothetical protein